VLAARHFLGRTDEFDFHRLKFAPKLGKKHEKQIILIEFHTIAVEIPIKDCLDSHLEYNG